MRLWQVLCESSSGCRQISANLQVGPILGSGTRLVLRTSNRLGRTKLQDCRLVINAQKLDAGLDYARHPSNDDIAEATVAYCFIVRNLSSI